MSVREIDYARHYGWWHDDSDEHFEEMSKGEASGLAHFMPKDRSAAVLDIGCGMGFALAGMRRLGYTDIAGIDSDRTQIAKAQARGLPAEMVSVADSPAWMAARQERYQLITAMDVVEHIPVAHQIDFLDAVRAMLVPGGMFICRVPNASSVVAAHNRYNDWTHHALFTEFSLDFILHNAGFVNIRIEEVGGYRFALNHLKRPTLLLLGAFRLFRRLELIAEFGGRKQGARIPMTHNIHGIGTRPPVADGVDGE